MGWGLILSVLTVLSTLAALVSAFYAWVDHRPDHGTHPQQATGRERGHQPRARRFRPVWTYRILAVSVFGVLVFGILLIAHPGSPPVKSPGTTSPSGGQASSAQPGGDGPTSPDQAGYISRWHRPVIIDNTGVIFQQREPVPADGSIDFDLEYYNSNWAGTEANLRLWLSDGAPSPADCISKDSGHTGIGTRAEVGDQYCFINNQSPNGPIVVLLRVTHIQTDNTTGVTSVTLDASAWAPQSPGNGQSSSAQPGGDGPTSPDQAGYISRWHRPVIIDNTGVIFQQREPVPADGSIDFDLEYYNSNWAGTEANLRLWLSDGAPSPADCISKDSGYTGIGTRAEVGDQYCFINNQSPNGPIVVLLRVTHIQTDNTTGVTSVTLDAWEWSPR